MPVSTAGVAREGGQYFLALRKPGTSIGESWEFPGGKAEPGETPEEALYREYQEEFGVEVKVGKRIFEGKFHNKTTEYQLLAFEITFVSGDVELTEHSEVRWFSAEELSRLPMADSDGLIRNYLLKNQ